MILILDIVSLGSIFLSTFTISLAMCFSIWDIYFE
jgi:hypothetical protein